MNKKRCSCLVALLLAQTTLWQGLAPETAVAQSKLVPASPPPAAAVADGYKLQADIVYGRKDGMALTYDVFTPVEHSNGIGLLLMVSGGWVSSWVPPDQAVKRFQPLLDRGYSVLTIRHGSSPRYLIPDIAGDVRQALQHVHDHADDYGIDAHRLGVFGFSAGGHLSLLLGTKTNDRGSPGTSPRVAAVVAVYPPTDLAPYVEPGHPLRERFPALKFDPKVVDLYSPLKQVSGDDAPTLLVHGDKDELVPIWHSQKIEQAFIAANVPCELLTIEGAGHGFNGDGSRRMFERMTEWFDHHLAADSE